MHTHTLSTGSFLWKFTHVHMHTHTHTPDFHRNGRLALLVGGTRLFPWSVLREV